VFNLWVLRWWWVFSDHVVCVIRLLASIRTTWMQWLAVRSVVSKWSVLAMTTPAVFGQSVSQCSTLLASHSRLLAWLFAGIQRKPERSILHDYQLIAESGFFSSLWISCYCWCFAKSLYRIVEPILHNYSVHFLLLAYYFLIWYIIKMFSFSSVNVETMFYSCGFL